MVTRVLPSGTSLRSDRTRAPASCSAVTSGTSDRSMSLFFMARTRRKSVRETLEVFFLLIPGRLSHGDDANLLIGFRVRDDDVLEHSQGYETVLAVFESVVLHRQSDPGENFWNVLEIEGMLVQIGVAFLVIPREVAL